MTAGVRILNESAPKAGTGCPTCGSGSGSTGGTAAHPAAMSGFVYAIGRLSPQFPDLGVEKEFTQMGGSSLATDRLLKVLKEPGAAYLARQLCWVFTAADTEAYVIVPRDDAETRTLVESLPAAEHVDETIQVIVGMITAAPPGAPCAAATIPAVLVDQHLTFRLNEFLDALDKDAKAGEHFRSAARELFARLTRRSDNRGLTDEHRAVNYLALRYPQLYRLVADAYAEGKTLTDVQVRRGPQGARRTVAVRPIFRTRTTDVVERYQCLVDVTDRFPFLSSSLAPVYD